MIYTKEIPQKYAVDVFIAGGGPAGVAAAVTCARQGKKVFLAEGCGAFGGLGTLGLVPAFMPMGDGEHFLCGGFGEELCTRLYGRIDGARRGYDIQVEKLKLTYDRMMRQSGADFSFFTRLIDVVVRDGRVTEAVCSAKSGLFTVKADVFIDCTGDGDLCAMAGADFEMGNEEGVCMPATLCSLWTGIDFDRVSGPANREVERAFADGVFELEDRHIPGIWTVDREHGVGGGNFGHCYAVDATDERSLTAAVLRGRGYMDEFKKYFSEYLTGYENMALVYTADMMGVRESRRITGEYVLSARDFRPDESFPDEIGRYNYSVDVHAMKPSKEAYQAFEKDFHNRLKTGESYSVPYRCLLPKKLANVLVAGRCVSTDRAMQASIRVMGGCFITGQAAGMAASLTRENVRDVAIPALQSKLRSIGAYLPAAE